VLTSFSAKNHPQNLPELGTYISCPEVEECTRRFLYSQVHPGRQPQHLSNCPIIHSRVYAVPSTTATYYTPSDESGTGGMHRTRIRSTVAWRNGLPRYNCVFISQGNALPGMRGLHVAQVMLFFRFTYNNIVFPCAFVRWFVSRSSSAREIYRVRRC